MKRGKPGKQKNTNLHKFENRLSKKHCFVAILNLDRISFSNKSKKQSTKIKTKQRNGNNMSFKRGGLRKGFGQTKSK